MNVTSLPDLYLAQLRDSHSAERQIIKALPTMVKAATNADLKKAFKDHLEETKEHVARLDLILADLAKSAGRDPCEAMIGLIAESAEVIENTEEGDVRDAGLICAAQKIEHYEIACYGCLRTFATLLERQADVKRLEKTLAEEKGADSGLTYLAMSIVNAEALAAG